MKQTFLVMILIVGIVFTSPLFALAADSAEAKEDSSAQTQKEKKVITPQTDDQKEKPILKGLESQGQKSTESASMPVYHPPLRGAPGGRVGGGTRGIGEELVALFALAPNHVALTVQEQPVLYWYLSKPAKYPIELTITIEKDTQPLLEKSIPLPSRSGIYSLRLSDFDIRLSTGTQYRWFLALVPDPNRRSRDIVAGAIIERVETPETLRSRLLKANREEISNIYAEAGMWYDALMAISNLIDDAPGNPAFHKHRAALLEQVGLSAVAQYDLKHGLTGK
jgi:hypothetical protein